MVTLSMRSLTVHHGALVTQTQMSLLFIAWYLAHSRCSLNIFWMMNETLKCFWSDEFFYMWQTLPMSLPLGSTESWEFWHNWAFTWRKCGEKGHLWFLCMYVSDSWHMMDLSTYIHTYNTCHILYTYIV